MGGGGQEAWQPRMRAGRSGSGSGAAASGPRVPHPAPRQRTASGPEPGPSRAGCDGRPGGGVRSEPAAAESRNAARP